MSTIAKLGVPLLVLLVLPLQGQGAPKTPEDNKAQVSSQLNDIDNDLTYLETSIGKLKFEFKSPEAKLEYNLEKRLLDATVFYQFGDYDKAAVLFMDLVNNPAFAGNKDFKQALYLLSRSLYETENFIAATKFFKQLLDQNDLQYRDLALSYLLEIAMTLKDYDSLNGLYPIIDAIPATARAEQLRYVYGKTLFFQNAVADAAAEFDTIEAGSPYYGFAQYYLGVLQTSIKQFEPAIAHFESATAFELPKDSKDVSKAKVEDVKFLSQLAIGRLQEELERYDDAITAYEKIPEGTPYYERALYEKTWSLIKKAQIFETKGNKDEAKTYYDTALATLDILVMQVQDEQLSIKANILRGRLNIFLNRYDSAQAAYQDVIDKFTPLKKELIEFTRKPANLDNYFKWLLAPKSEKITMKVPVTDRLENWIQGDKKMFAIIKVYVNLSQEKKKLAALREDVKQIKLVLDGTNYIEIFPNLAEGWLQVAEYENQLISMNDKLLALEEQLISPYLTQSEINLLQNYAKIRKSNHAKVLAGPKTVEEIKGTKTKVEKKFSKLQKSAFLIETDFVRMENDLIALEKWVNQSKFTKEALKMSPVEEEQLNQEIVTEKKQIKKLYEEIQALKKDIEEESVSTGITDLAPILSLDMGSLDEAKETPKPQPKKKETPKPFVDVKKDSVAKQKEAQAAEKKMQALKKQAFALEQALAQLESEVMSLEKWIELSLMAKGSMKLDSATEKELVDLIDEEAKNITEMFAELVAIKDELQMEIAIATVEKGPGEFFSTDTSAVKSEAMKSQQGEADFLKELAKKLPPAEAKIYQRIQQIRARIWADFSSIAAILKNIDGEAKQEVALLQQEITQQETLITQYEKDLNKNATQLSKLTSDVGKELFSVAQEEVAGIVLEADLGLLDIAWQKKQMVTNSIQEGSLKRAAQLEAINEEFGDVVNK